MTKPLAILASDWHIRPDIPRGRIDNYLKAQFIKVSSIIHLSDELNVPILIAGDLGNKPKWPDWLIKEFMDILLEDGIQRDVFVIPGQHDLLNHKLDLWPKHGIGVLDEARSIEVLDGYKSLELPRFRIYSFPYGIKIVHPSESGRPNIAMAHQMVIKNKPLWPGQEAPKGTDLLKKFHGYDIILTGDNHKTFVSEYEGRYLVNPGSLMRMAIDQIDHKPCVFIWNDDNSIEQHFLPIGDNVFSLHSTQNKEERNEIVDSYIEQLNTRYEVKLSFEDNAERHFDENNTEEGVKNKVYLFMEEKR